MVASSNPHPILQITDFETGFTVSPALREILVKSFVERFDMVFPSQHHHGSKHTQGLFALPAFSRLELALLPPYCAAVADSQVLMGLLVACCPWSR